MKKLANTLSLKELRPRLPQVMEAVDERMERFTITKRGKPCAVIMSPDDLEGLLETLDILEDKTLMKRLRKAERDVRAGRTRSLEEIRKSLGRV